MRHTDRICFDALKQAVADKYRQSEPEAPEMIGDWKGKEIEGFQNDLLEKARGRISTKWFYTHIKNEQDSLPRIDVLNLLCTYVGHESWDDYLNHLNEAGVIGDNASDSEQVEQDREQKKAAKVPWKEYGAAVLALGLLGLLSWSWNGSASNDKPMRQHHFCFYDADFGQAIPGAALSVTVLRQGESPQLVSVDSAGCVTIEMGETASQLRFAVAAEMYQPDTITRANTPQAEAESIELKRDDYAWLIQAFSSSNVTDWERRRAQLDQMFHNDAIVFQVAEAGGSMELYNKEEFIGKLSVPTSSLKNIKIIETHYEQNQIIELRFIQNN